MQADSPDKAKVLAAAKEVNAIRPDCRSEDQPSICLTGVLNGRAAQEVERL